MLRRNLSFALILLAWPCTASASFWDLYGFNPRAVGLAGTHTAITDDFTAVHYNPAALASIREPIFGFAMVASRESLNVDFEGASQIPALDAPNATAISFGSVFPLGGKATRGRIAFGLGLSVPTRSLLNGQAVDPAVPHWYIYNALPERILANVGLGVRPLDFLSLGVGVQFLAGVSGRLDYELDVVSGRFSRKSVQFDIEPRAAPVLGVEARLLDSLRIGFSYRRAIEAAVELPVALVVTGIADVRVDTAFTVQYNPDRLNLGASYLIEEFGLLVSAEATLALWSSAPDPSVDSRLDVRGDLFDGTGLGDALDAPSPGQARRVDLGFRNVLIPRLGVERDFGPLTLRAGYAIRPSPAPVQTTGTNYIDGTSHQIGAGLSLRWRDPWGMFANDVIVDLGLQLAVLPSRRHEKTSSDDPVGSFSAGGSIFVSGLALRYEFAEAPAAPAAQTQTRSNAVR